MPGSGEITAAELDYYQRLYESMYGPPPGMSGFMGPGYGPGGLPSVSQLMQMAMTTPLFPFGKTIRKRRRCVRRKPRRPNAQEGSLYYNKKNRLYEVRICNQNKQIYLGQFESEGIAEQILQQARAAKLSGTLLEFKEQLKQRKHLLTSGKNQKRNARGHFVRQRSAKPPTYLSDVPLRTSRVNPRDADIDEIVVRKGLDKDGKSTGDIKATATSGRGVAYPGNCSPIAKMLDVPKGFSIIDLEACGPIVSIKTEE